MEDNVDVFIKKMDVGDGMLAKHPQLADARVVRRIKPQEVPAMEPGKLAQAIDAGVGDQAIRVGQEHPLIRKTGEETTTNLTIPEYQGLIDDYMRIRDAALKNGDAATEAKLRSMPLGKLMQEAYGGLQGRSAFELIQAELAQMNKSRETAKVEEGTPVSERKTIPLTEDQVKELTNQAYKYLLSLPGLQITPTIYEPPSISDIPPALNDYWKKLDPEIGMQFDGHGIKQHELKNLVHLLNNGIDKKRPFFSMNLKVKDEDRAAAIAMGADGPYRDSLIALGPPGEQITNSGIAAVLVNEQFYAAIPVLQQHYPNIKFIKASDMEAELKKMIDERKSKAT